MSYLKKATLNKVNSYLELQFFLWVKKMASWGYILIIKLWIRSLSKTSTKF